MIKISDQLNNYPLALGGSKTQALCSLDAVSRACGSSASRCADECHNSTTRAAPPRHTRT